VDGGTPPASTPSPANPGWIGGACASPADCPYPEALCLTSGFPNGTCSKPCDGVCPDRDEPDDTPTFCVDGSPFGATEGICVSQCDREEFPETGCADGYACVERNRYAQPTSVEQVCLPVVPRACPGEDELIDLPYPDAGKVYLPHEARCGGSFDLVVMLHGINPTASRAPSLGGGRRLELLARHLVDAGVMRPILLAEPVHLEATSATLYGPEFDPVKHIEAIEGVFGAKRIKIGALSYTGHSGAGCHEDNGLYRVLARLPDLVPAHAPFLALWGLMDVCYETSYHWERPLSVLSYTSTAIVNVYSVQGDPDAFEENLLGASLTLPCSPELYISCLAHAERPWCSYRTRAAAGINHENNPYFFVRDVFPRVFPARGKPSVCGR
jgi:hypothetical protein